VLLATPVASLEELWGQYKGGAGAYLPLGLLSIAGVALRSGLDVKICDASNWGTTEAEFRKMLVEEEFDVIGLGNCYTALAHIVFRTARICREVLPESPIIVGGIHPTLFPKETLEACKEIDFVVYGEGEYTFRELLEYFKSKDTNYGKIPGIAFRDNGSLQQNQPRALISDLGELPDLPFHLLPMKLYNPPPSNYKKLPTFGLLIQRGCPYSCIYCDSRIHGKKVRHENMDKFFKKLRHLKDNYGLKGILFHDSAFTINNAFAAEFCQRMIRDKLDLVWTCSSRVDRVNPKLLSLMKKAGCWAVAYGFEAGTDASLKMIKKGVTLAQNYEAAQMTRKAGMQVIGSMIICLPGEDEAMVRKTIEFTKKAKLDTAIFFLPIPFPGTELYEVCKTDGGLKPNIKWEDYNQWIHHDDPLYINPMIGKKRMVELYSYAVRSFYLSPGTILRIISNIRTAGDFRKYFTGFKSIAGIIKRSFVSPKAGG